MPAAYDSVDGGDSGPSLGHPLSRTGLVMYAGGPGDVDPVTGEAVAVLP